MVTLLRIPSFKSEPTSGTFLDKNGNMVTGEQVIDMLEILSQTRSPASAFFAKAVMVSCLLRDPKGVRPSMDSTTCRSAKMFAILMAIKCIVAQTCMAQPSISMKRQVFKPKIGFIRFADGRTRYHSRQKSLQSTVLRKILRTRLGITLIATVTKSRDRTTNHNGKQYYFDNEGRQVKGHFCHYQ